MIQSTWLRLVSASCILTYFCVFIFCFDLPITILILCISVQVLVRGVDCDIALLSVESEDFWKGAEPLRLGHLPRLQVPIP